MHCEMAIRLWRLCDALGNVLLGLAINVDVNLTRATYLNIVADQYCTHLPNNVVPWKWLLSA